MTPIDRQGMIDALLLDDVHTISLDLKQGDFSYLMLLLEGRRPYSEWTNLEVEESYNDMIAHDNMIDNDPQRSL